MPQGQRHVWSPRTFSKFVCAAVVGIGCSAAQAQFTAAQAQIVPLQYNSALPGQIAPVQFNAAQPAQVAPAQFSAHGQPIVAEPLVAPPITGQPTGEYTVRNGVVYAPGFDPYNCPPINVTQPPAPRLGIFGEFLYLKPRGVDIPFAVPQDGLVIPGATPVGPVANVDQGYSPGFRVGGFLAAGDNARLVGTFTWFDSSSDETVSINAPNVINPLVLFPGTFNAGFTAQQASANYDINFQMIDADYLFVAECANRYWYGYSAGARFAQLNQEFNATFNFAPPDGTTTLNTEVDFTGIGPKIGTTGEWTFNEGGGFRLYGNAAASFLAGEFKTSYLQSNQFGGVEVSTSATSNRIVPILDLELGLAWVSQQERVRLSAGYMISAWFNSVTSKGWIDAVQARTYNPGSETVTFDGLTARAELRF